jgi:hypothetical protein
MLEPFHVTNRLRKIEETTWVDDLFRVQFKLSQARDLNETIKSHETHCFHESTLKQLFKLISAMIGNCMSKR